MRFKRRYFCVELVVQGTTPTSNYETKLKSSDLVVELTKSIEKFFGDLGVASMQPSFSLIYFNANTNLAIFRIAREHRAKFHQLLALVRRIDSTDLALKVIHVAGSIKQCKKYLLKDSNRKLEELAEIEANFF